MLCTNHWSNHSYRHSANDTIHNSNTGSQRYHSSLASNIWDSTHHQTLQRYQHTKILERGYNSKSPRTTCRWNQSKRHHHTPAVTLPIVSKPEARSPPPSVPPTIRPVTPTPNPPVPLLPPLPPNLHTSLQRVAPAPSLVPASRAVRPTPWYPSTAIIIGDHH